MAKATATCPTSRSTMQYFRPRAASGAQLNCLFEGELGLLTRSSSALEESPGPVSRVPGVTDDPADHRGAARLLLIDDDPDLIQDQLRRAYPALAHRLHVARNRTLGIEYVRSHSPDVVVLHLGPSEQSGFELFKQIREINARVLVILITGARRADAAIEAMKQGAYDCLFEPLDPPLLRRVVGDALEVARRMGHQAAPEDDGTEAEAEGSIVGSCPAMGEVYKAVGRVAGQSFPVLITGESGTGKELVARAIYQHGPRAGAPFLALNCAAIPENLLESELFGHEKGAFTGADRRRIGKFEQCNGGTLFLDEIGDMPQALQAKILRLLQEQSFERVGGNETIRTDVRLIAATHRDLKALSGEGKFRADLYYRLGVFSILLPPLRERGEDLPLLVRHYLRRFSRELGREVRHVAPEAMELLCRYPWPGNIRELQSVLKQALLRASGSVLLPAFLPEILDAPEPAALPLSVANGAGSEMFVVRQRIQSNARELYSQTHRQLDRFLLARVMEHTRGNLQKAAILLGIARQTLRTKLRDLGLAPVRAELEEEDPQNVNTPLKNLSRQFN